MTKVHPRINNRSLCNRPFHRAGKTLNESRKVIRPGRGEGGGRGEGLREGGVNPNKCRESGESRTFTG